MSCFKKLKRQCGDGAHKAAIGCSLLFASFLAVSPVQAQTVNINVVTPDPANPDNFLPVDGFRWLIEEDNTWNIKPGVATGKTLATGFHSSHSPVIAKGESAMGNQSPVSSPDLDPAKRYFLSVTPHSGYTIGGAEINEGATDVEVVVNPLPLPTAQFSVLVFEDFSPINGAPDLPEENPATSINPSRINEPDGGHFDPTQFRVLVEEAGGRYGATGGPVSQDAFGNPLGTEYQYDAQGNAVLDVDGSPIIVSLGDGIIHPGADGYVVVKNLPPAKYGVIVTPPTGKGWIQTSTIEGTAVIDVWPAANEPSYFVEFGPPGFHAFLGFTKQVEDTAYKTDNAGTATITGQVVNNHMSRPPELAFYNGDPTPGCWVGLNRAPNLSAIDVQPCNDNSEFTFSNVPAGDYTIAIWDTNLDIVIAQKNVTVPATPNALVDLAELPVFNWFARLSASVFNDENQNGFRDPGETNLGADASAVNLRFRNGTIYQSFPIDTEGEAPFDEVFPFFHWLVAEVDFATLKATGATYVVDNGGEVRPDAGWDDPTFDKLNPQPQFCTQARIDVAVDMGDTACIGATAGDPAINPNTGNNLSTTLQGQILTLGMQDFLGQTNRLEFGKRHYPDGENGGISGIIYYAITRAENDPRFAVGEEWEPGIPRVQVNLYKDAENDGLIDTAGGGNAPRVNGVSQHTPPDIDLYPLGNFPGPEDTDRNGNGSFDLGDAIQVTYADSWDDSNPTACQGDSFTAHPELAPNGAFTTDCYDGLRNFNQITNGVFDGGYAFSDLQKGAYIVEAVLPAGYELVKEEDRNVDYGDTYVPAPLQLPPECIGDNHTVPPYMSYLTDANGAPLVTGSTPDAAPFAGQTRPLCDRKSVLLTTGKNAAADFFMFTDVPIAAHVVGGILDDTANEFDPNSPNFGEKYAPPWLPVSFKDWTGREILRTYSDEWGHFNALLPSTYSVNLPMPTGVSPNMLTACMNDASPVYNPVTGKLEADPFHDPQYSQFCYTFQYMPGSTTYLDTPVVPVAAFAGPNQFPLDCALPTQTPGILKVESTNASTGPAVVEGDTVTITSQGIVQVPNPEFDGTANTTKTVARDYGFGTSGTLTLGGTPITNAIWSNETITFDVPAGASTGQLEITSATGEKSVNSVTLNILAPGETVTTVYPTNNLSGTPIQDAIDAANPGDLILVSPGDYHELVIMHKPVRLQGFGAASTTINAVRAPALKLQNWRDKVYQLAVDLAFDLLPGQTLGGLNIVDQVPIFGTEEGPAILVVGNVGEYAGNQSRIDGLGITGAIDGGGIFVGGYVDNLEISNNKVYTNSGNFGGGIRVGYPDLVTTVNDASVHVDAQNNNINIHNNQINQNGGNGGVGGGVALYTGSDNYQITSNMLCGNFSMGSGAGIGHLGLSNNGVIANNTIAYNQTFNQGLEVHGGGIYIAGKEGLANAVGGVSQTPGSGSVLIEGNMIMGNQAGAGSGGGVKLSFINGADVEANPATSSLWHSIRLYDNIIVNNVAGRDGGGVSIHDASAVSMVHNTIAYNDSTATTALSMNPAVGVTRDSSPQPGAGVASHLHTADLASATGQSFSDPEMVNNIILRNRSFYWFINGANAPQTFGLVPDIGNGDAPVYSDIAVVDNTALTLHPKNTLLTNIAENQVYRADPADGNWIAGPNHKIFIDPLENGQPGQTLQQQEQTTSINIAAALDEGGNFIDVRFGPLTLDPTLRGNYRLDNNSSNRAIDRGQADILIGNANLSDADFYGTPRFYGSAPEIGAEELALGAIPVAVDDVRRVNRSGPIGDLQAYTLNIQNLLNNDIDTINWQAAVPVTGSETGGGVLSWNDPLARQFTFRTPTGSASVGQFSFQYKASASPLANAATVTLNKDISVDQALAIHQPNSDISWSLRGWTTFAPGTPVSIYLNGTATGTPFQNTIVRPNGRWTYGDSQGPATTGVTEVSVRIGNRVLNHIPLEIR
ncbi:hypothetical protein [Amphritea pacifica]|uniref:Uncharacterized protein n=1 Tax=Amphritea pacifica TaxID=2811233 RepID=A0ABS2W745_9GAMM|nr:hypothetical protein [Amphritea pacifica]MBN0987529.1 hypothetical protein [Amphritea pacifica]MBN1005148.1 hypothetical protein [Amphritea pacifica]